MEDNRPDPDELLRQIKGMDTPAGHGKLKIFFGYAAGVGKTFAMLEAAHSAMEAGIDVLAGYVEPHTRPETLALLKGLPQLPSQKVEYKDVLLNEFDIDAAIARKPKLVLVDELAHTNATGCRHLKRYQDIEELLRLGIDVYTTVNVQHIESLNDIVASITGVVVRERIPDSVFDSADQVELVDIEPDDLIDRLNRGKVYSKNQARRALESFFVRENLIALREIALRRTADRVNRIAGRESPTQRGGYFTGEHILICLSSAPSNQKVIRTASRMADAFHGKFTALFVQTPNSGELKGENLVHLRENLKLAEQLGAQIATVYGEDVAYQIAQYAKAGGISKIIMGRSNNRKRFFWNVPHFIDTLTDLAPNLDIYVIPDGQKQPYSPKSNRTLPPKLSLTDTLKMVGILCLCTLIGFIFDYLGFSEANVITIYILGALITSMITVGMAYSVAVSVLSVLIFNFFFTDPRLTFQAFDKGYPVTFLVMFLSALITGTLTKRVKRQSVQSSQKAYRTGILLETSQKLQRAKNTVEIISQTAQQMCKLLDSDIVFYSVENEQLSPPMLFPVDKVFQIPNEYFAADEQAVANWAYKNNKHAGATTGTLPGAKCLYLAVRGMDTVFAVVAIPIKKGETLESFEKNLLLAMLSECAMALEKEIANITKNEIAMTARQEQLRANLLRTISHDLRTPLTSISGNAGILMSNAADLGSDKCNELYTDIYDDSMWLISLVENLLAVTRIENGMLGIKMQSELVSEIVEDALQHVNRRACEHSISVDIPDEMLMAEMDCRLIVQVIINLIDNAIKYTPVGSSIVVSAREEGTMVALSVADNGTGISDLEKPRLFSMFATADKARSDARRGLGLGLALCKSIVNAHGGRIDLRDNTPNGCIFIFTLKKSEVSRDE